MKVKNLLFVTFFLASAGLGLALPSTHQRFFPRVGVTEVSEVKKTILDAADAASPGGTISTNCAAALVAIGTSPEFLQCVPPTSLLPIVPIITDPSVLQAFLKDPAANYGKLIEKPLISFATQLCAAPKCSDKGDADAIKTLATGCSEDLKTNQFIQLLFTLAVFYSPLRDIVCFKDKDQFCFDQTALTLIKLPKSPIPITNNPFLDSVAVADPAAICTKCNKDIVNTIFNFLQAKKDQKDPIPFQILSQAKIGDKEIDEGKLGAIVKCGLQFLDGKTP